MKRKGTTEAKRQRDSSKIPEQKSRIYQDPFVLFRDYLKLHFVEDAAEPIDLKRRLLILLFFKAVAMSMFHLHGSIG
jgi:hypothetical protein